MYVAGDEDAVRAESDDGRGVVRCYCRRRHAVRPAADDANPPLDWLPRRAGKLHTALHGQLRSTALLVS